MTSVLLFLFVGRLICVHTFIIFFVTIKAKQCMVCDTYGGHMMAKSLILCSPN